MAKVLYVDMDGVLVNFVSARPRVSEDDWKQYEGHPDDIPGIFGRMDPMDGAVAAFQELAGLFDIYVLTTASWENPSAWSDKLEWVKRYLGPVAKKRLIITHHKELNRGDFLIDDRTNNGATDFTGEFIQFGSPQYPNWEIVVHYLRQKATEA